MIPINRDTVQDPKSWINLAALRGAEGKIEFRGPTRALLLFLACRSDDYGCCWHRQALLAEGAGCSERTIRKHLRVLVAVGLLRKIGRSRGGAQVSNVYHLIGWPERIRIPAGGHPRLGRYIREEPLANLLHALNRQQNPHAAAPVADQNKVMEKITAAEAEKQAILDRCLLALGSWATADNRRYLMRSRDALFNLLANGHDLDRHVIPSIRAMVNGDRPVPSLKSWAYFGNAVKEYADSLAAAHYDPAYRPGLDPVAKDRAQETPSLSDHYSGTDNPAVMRFLRQLTKPGRLGPIGGEG